MGKILPPKPVQLIIGLLSESPEAAATAMGPLLEKFGPSELLLECFPFTFTNYYENEIGSSPVRSFVAFETLIPREQIPDIKLWTNDLEVKLFGGKRRVNLDPGYMTLGQFFLATTKDQRQRVYIRGGIFVEPTLYFQDGNWHHFDWTYRDYQSEPYLKYFKQTRERLAYQLRTGRPYSKRNLPEEERF